MVFKHLCISLILIFTCCLVTLCHPPTAGAKVYGVQCADNSQHPPGFDCEAYMKGRTGSKATGNEDCCKTITDPPIKTPPKLDLNKFSAQELFSRARGLWAKRKDTGLALRMLRKAVEKSPNHLGAWRLLAQMLVHHGLTTESQDAYCEVVRLSPNDQEARRNCPRTREQDWQKEQARQKQQRYIWEQVNSANQLYKKGSYKKALALLKRVKREHGGSINPELRKFADKLSAKLERILAYHRKKAKGEKKIEAVVEEMGRGFDTKTGQEDSSAGLDFMSDDAEDTAAQKRAESNHATSSQAFSLVKSRYAARALRSLKTAKVPPPSGYKNPAQRRRILAAMSDEHIERELKRMRRILTGMQKNSQKDVAALDQLMHQMNRHEWQAINHCIMLLTGASLEYLPQATENQFSLKFIAKRAHKLWGHKKPFEEAVKSEAGYRENVEMARSVMLDAYDTMAQATKVLVDDPAKRIGPRGPQLATLFAFFVDYSYAMGQWNFARNQLQVIIDNLDRPAGKLKAQKAISGLYEAMIKEQKRRKLHNSK